MSATLISINPENIDSRKIDQITDELKNGAIIAYPTDTIYAIGCNMYDLKAINRICQLKGENPKKMNFSIICSDLSDLSTYARQISNSVFKMMRSALPGPYTFILDASRDIPKLLNPGKKTIGIRIPDHSIPIAIVKALGNPIITTSIHDEDVILEYMTDPNQIFSKFQHQLDIVVDGGNGLNQPSTVINASGDDIEVLRIGLGNHEDIGLTLE